MVMELTKKGKKLEVKKSIVVKATIIALHCVNVFSTLYTYVGITLIFQKVQRSDMNVKM